MRNITFSAEEHVIRRARQRAKADNTTLNNEFRRWLSQYAQGIRTSGDYLRIMKHLSYCQPGKTFSREEINER